MARSYRRRLGAGRSGGVAARGRTYYPVAPIRKRRRGGSAPLRLGPLTQLRRGGSRTATKTKRKKKYQSQTKTGENTSVSATYYPGSKNRLNTTLFKKIMGRRQRLQNFSGRIVSNFGQQAIQLFSHMGRGDLNTLLTEFTTAVPTLAGNSVKLYLSHKKYRTIFKNQSNLPCKVLVYDISCRATPHTVATDTPLEAWQVGLASMGAAATPHLYPGSTPFMSPEFKRNFRVEKVTSIPMEPGQEHEHTTHHKLNKIVDSTRWDQSTMTPIPGLTTFTMIVFYGSLVHENLAVGVVTPGVVNLDWATYEEIGYGWVPYASPSLVQVNNFALAITNPDFMGEVGDTDADIINS